MDQENKQTAEEIQLLVQQIQELQSQIMDLSQKIDKRVIEVAKRYIVAAHDENRGYGYPSVTNAHFNWEMDENGNIEVHWEETWAYGGYDAGSFIVPANFVWDEDALVAYEKERANHKTKREEQKVSAQREKEIEQLKKLQKKYGDQV